VKKGGRRPKVGEGSRRSVGARAKEATGGVGGTHRRIHGGPVVSLYMPMLGVCIVTLVLVLVLLSAFGECGSQERTKSLLVTEARVPLEVRHSVAVESIAPIRVVWCGIDSSLGSNKQANLEVGRGGSFC
jgi:hypothetical protein